MRFHSFVVASSIIFSPPSLTSAEQAREGGAALTVTVKDSYGVIPGRACASTRRTGRRRGAT
jgi:hypothetical protein